MATIAFIPVRGGSKSIPLKNIKDFCGQPLVYWTVRAAAMAECVDRVIIATDSNEIKEVVQSFDFKKTVCVYERDAVNAQDTSSTESVMLEYIERTNVPDSDVFILIQATSPLTSSKDIDSGYSQLISSGKDSLLSAVLTKRFFWKRNGTSVNYDYRNRPRRQDFPGILMENGAFYINRVGNIRRDRNRLSGNIDVFIMPDYSGIEIDEPDDWELLESLMRKHILKPHDKSKSKVKLFLTDVDGVLTDGGMYYSEKGDELKKFNTRDGMAFELLRNAGIKTGIITSEDTDIVRRRAAKLKADYLKQGKRDGGKLHCALEICNELGIALNEVAYIGDDINCHELLCRVGTAACPADAAEKIRKIPGIIVFSSAGGAGVVREFAELILNRK